MRGRELKYRRRSEAHAVLQFALMRGRELKWRRRADTTAAARVRPHARAGVEIFPTQARRRQSRVRPHARAGVEMRGCTRPVTSTRFALMRGRELKCAGHRRGEIGAIVRPHARAGVEIASAASLPPPEDTFALMRGRELKYRTPDIAVAVQRFALMRGRELKFMSRSSSVRRM